MSDTLLFYWEHLWNTVSKTQSYKVFKDLVLPIINMLIVVGVFVLSDIFRRKEINGNRKYQQECDKPLFMFDPIKIDYEIGNVKRNIVNQLWAYPEGNIIDKYKESNYVQDDKFTSMYRIKNVGKEVAKDIKFTINFIEGKKFLEEVKLDTLNLGLGKKFSISIKEYDDNNNTFKATLTSNKVHNFYINGKENGNKRSYRLLPPGNYIELPIDKGDLAIFNLHLYCPNNNVIPYVSINIDYKDRFGNSYNENLNIAIRVRHANSNLDDTGFVRATLDEFSKEDMEYYNKHYNVTFIN